MDRNSSSSFTSVGCIRDILVLEVGWSKMISWKAFLRESTARRGLVDSVENKNLCYQENVSPWGRKSGYNPLVCVVLCYIWVRYNRGTS